MLQQIDAGGLGADERLVHRSLAAVAERAGRARWIELLDESARLEDSSRLEIALLAARCGQLEGPQREAAIALASSNPLFVGRVSEL